MIKQIHQSPNAHGIISESERNGEWFLGYDSACSSCSSLREAVDEIAGGDLVTISLHDPIVTYWREKALGPDAPWAPTLFRVRGDRVEAWVGRRIALRLAAVLGPQKALRLARAVGEAANVSGEERNGIDRRAFLRGLGGVAAGVALLQVSEADAQEIDPLSDHITCGVNWTAATGYYTVLPGGANCRRCPRLNSPIDAFVAGNNNFHYRGYTSSGEAVWDPVLEIMNTYWWRSSGPTGCWVSGTRLP